MGCGANSKVGNNSDDSYADLIRPGPSKKPSKGYKNPFIISDIERDETPFIYKIKRCKVG